MTQPTPTQVALLEKIGVADGDALWALLHEDRKSGTPGLPQVAERIQSAFWDMESAEKNYADALAGLVSRANQQVEALAKSQHTETMWINQSAQDAVKASVELKTAIASFRVFVSLRAAILADA